MRVVVFTNPEDGAVARIEVPAGPGPAPKGKPKSAVMWLPVAIHAPTEAEAREKAEAFYQAELDRFAKQAEAKARAAQSLAEYRAAKKAAIA